MRRTGLVVAGILLGLATRSACLAQGLEYVLANYTKYEYRIPMRDGVKLYTVVYVPKDRQNTYPILLSRTPYSVGPYGADQYKADLGPSDHFGRAGYIVAYQDVRGRWRSEGEFVNMRPMLDHEADPKAIDESTDTFDTIDWLVKNVAGNNGRVGMWGISYPGFYTAAGSVDAHPALVAISPQAPVTDWFAGDDWHHNGAFFLPHAFNFLASFGRPLGFPPAPRLLPFDYGTPDGYQFYLDVGPLPNVDSRYFRGEIPFWNEIMNHPNYDDFWKARNLRAHLRRIKPATMTVGGWFDAENLFGALETYRSIEASSPGAQNTLVMGPWRHGGWSHGEGSSLGPLSFHAKTGEFYRESIEFPFFEHHLKGVAIPELPEAFVFDTGRHEWIRHAAWPPAGNRVPFYLGPDSTLTSEAPTLESSEAYDTYTSDPAHPVPYTETVQIGMTGDYMTHDQRFAARRPDVLAYQTEPLETDLTIAGPISVEMTVSTSGSDSDWVVKLIDVYPDTNPPSPAPDWPRQVMAGFQQMVRGDVLRGRFREGLDQPKSFQPDQPTVIRFTLPDACHTFRSGHRVMVQIQSTWFPLVDRNPQTFVDIYKARTTDFQKANQRVYRSRSRASRVILPVAS